MRMLYWVLPFVLFIHSSVSATTLFSLENLKQESSKVVPKGLEIQTSDQESTSAFIAYGRGDESYQFTLSTDKEVQQIPEEKFTVDGRECTFFRPLGESSGGVFVPLKSKGSLTILLMKGMFSDDLVSMKQMKKMVQKMDINSFE